MAQRVKQLHEHTCQICGLRLITPTGPYAEAAHIRPLGRPHDGPDTADNILCLCPNDHVLFDTGAVWISDNDEVRVTRGGGERRLSNCGLVLNTACRFEHLRYHREHIAQD